MERVENLFDFGDKRRRLGERAQEEQRFVEAKQRLRVGKIALRELIEQALCLCSFGATEAALGGFQIFEERGCGSRH